MFYNKIFNIIPISSVFKGVSTDNEYKSDVLRVSTHTIRHFDFSIIFDGMMKGMLSECKTWQIKEWKWENGLIKSSCLELGS